jgi:hypothetical protein
MVLLMVIAKAKLLVVALVEAIITIPVSVTKLELLIRKSL